MTSPDPSLATRAIDGASASEALADDSLGDASLADASLADASAGATLPAARPVENMHRKTLLVAFLALTIEAVLVWVALRLGIPIVAVLGGHILVVCALGYWVYVVARVGADVSEALLLLTTTAAIGPLGAAGTLLLGLTSGLGREDLGLLKRWYERISQSTKVDDASRHCDKVAVGRTMDLLGDAPDAFCNVLVSGTLQQKQNVLGIVARNFHPDYLPALQVALKSELPVIRVQAAAVAAHVRLALGEQLRDLMTKGRALETELADGAGTSTDAGGAFALRDGNEDQGDRPTEELASRGLALAQQMDACLAGGLLDAKDESEARALSARLQSRALALLGGGSIWKGQAAKAATAKESDGETDTEADADADAETDADANLEALDLANAYETALLRNGQYAAFRDLRGEPPADARSPWRIRPLGGARAGRQAVARQSDSGNGGAQR